MIRRKRGEDVSTPGTLSSSARGHTAASKDSVSSSLASARNKEGAVWGETPLPYCSLGNPINLNICCRCQCVEPGQNRMVRSRDVSVATLRCGRHYHCLLRWKCAYGRVILDAVQANLMRRTSRKHAAALISGRRLCGASSYKQGDPDIQNNQGKMAYNLASSHRSYQFSKEASMLVDIRMKNVLARKKLEEIRERQYRERQVDTKVYSGVDLNTLNVTGKSVFASVVQQLKDAALKKRRLFGSVIEDLATMFNAADIDGDGHITTEELSAAFRRLDLGFEPDQIAVMMQKMDEDGNNTIEREEFFAAIEKFAQT